MELKKEIGWERPKSNSNDGSYDDTVLRNQIKTLNEELNEMRENMVFFEDVDDE